jgi:hypothetical protein
MDAAEKTKTPGIVLMVVGIVHLLYYLVFTGWGLFGLLLGGFGTLLQIFAALDNSDNLVAALMSAWGVIVGLVRTLVFACLILTSGLVIRGGLAAQSLSNYGAARTGAILAGAGPLVGVLAGLLGLLSCQCGVFCGLVPDVVMLLLGGGAGFFAFGAINDPEVRDAFAS